jgi:hypothetical protein
MEYGNDPLDEVIPRLASLRELSWDRPDHRERLEMRLMNSNRSLGPLRWLTSKAALFLGVVLLGGAAAGATTMWILSEVTVEPGTPDGQGNCTWIITHPDGTKEETEPLPEDSGWFVIDGGDGGDSTLVGVEKADDAAGDGSTQPPASDAK